MNRTLNEPHLWNEPHLEWTAPLMGMVGVGQWVCLWCATVYGCRAASISWLMYFKLACITWFGMPTNRHFDWEIWFANYSYTVPLSQNTVGDCGHLLALLCSRDLWLDSMLRFSHSSEHSGQRPSSGLVKGWLRNGTSEASISIGPAGTGLFITAAAAMDWTDC